MTSSDDPSGVYAARFVSGDRRYGARPVFDRGNLPRAMEKTNPNQERRPLNVRGILATEAVCELKKGVFGHITARKRFFFLQGLAVPQIAGLMRGIESVVSQFVPFTGFG